MPEPLPFTALPGSERARRFEGKDHGANVSFFLSTHAPGEGPRLHRHPYEETFVLLDGRATFTVGDETLEPAPGRGRAARAGPGPRPDRPTWHAAQVRQLGRYPPPAGEHPLGPRDEPGV